METIEGVREVELALEAREEAQRRFDAAVGTSTEMGAYIRLRAATRRIAEVDRAAREQEPQTELRPV